MNKSFNVLQCLFQPTWHFDAYNNKCSLVAKKSQVSLSSICLQPHLEVSRKRNKTSYFFPSFCWGMDFTGEERDETNNPKNRDLFSAADAKSRLLTVIWLCGKPPWFPFLQAHALTIKCPCPCFKENKKRSKVRKKKWLVFSTVSVERVIKT